MHTGMKIVSDHQNIEYELFYKKISFIQIRIYINKYIYLYLYLHNYFSNSATLFANDLTLLISWTLHRWLGFRDKGQSKTLISHWVSCKEASWAKEIRTSMQRGGLQVNLKLSKEDFQVYSTVLCTSFTFLLVYSSHSS